MNSNHRIVRPGTTNRIDIEQIRLLLTDTCNAKCMNCHNEGQQVEGKVMSIDWIRTLIHQLSTLHIGEIVLSGGEPLLHPQIESVIELIRSNLNCKISINTNGLVGDKLINIYPLVDEVKFHVESSVKEEYETLMKLDFNRFKEVLHALPSYSKVVFSSILRSEQQALNLINFAYNYKNSSVKFNELMVEPAYTLEQLETCLLNKDFQIIDQLTNGSLLGNREGQSVRLRLCKGNTPFINTSYHLRRDLQGVSVNLTPVLERGSTEELFFLLGSVEEIEYRWCIPQPVFSYIGSKLGLQTSYQYQMDRVYTLNDVSNAYFRIKDRGGKLSFDIKGRDSDTEMFREQTVHLTNLVDALEFANTNAKPSISIEKLRATTRIGNCELSLDILPGVGYFIEIEGTDAQLLCNRIGLDVKQQAKPYGYYIENGISPIPIDLEVDGLNLNFF